MSDITKCENEECPIKHTCRRWLMPAGEYQWYDSFQYSETEGCFFHWDYESEATKY